MQCKNCDVAILDGQNYCSACGAKVIRHRLTTKSLMTDFFERYFNLDNTFFRTIWHTIIKPEAVCNGYIQGLRKRYLNPVSMIAISLTTSGLIMFLIKKVVWGKIDFAKISYAQTSSGGVGTEKIMSATMEYSSFVYFLYIPIIAFASYVLFNKRNYNYPEHIIITIYALTTFSIASSLYSATALLISPQFYFDAALAYVLVMVLFCLYVAYKNSEYNRASLLWRTPLFLLIFLFGYFGASLLTVAILFLTGEISISDFIP